MATGSAPARADATADYARLQACVKSASPCDAVDCIDGFVKLYPKTHDTELTKTRERAEGACADLHRRQASTALQHCLASLIDGRPSGAPEVEPSRACVALGTSGASAPPFAEGLAAVNGAAAPLTSVPPPIVSDARGAARPPDAPSAASATDAVEPPLGDTTVASARAEPDIKLAPKAGHSATQNATAGCGHGGALGTAREAVVNAPEGGLHIGLESYNKTLDLADKEVALTFDDGPNPGTTERVLDALDSECVKATFFLIGRNAVAHPDLVRREIHDGHTIGNHSWSHPARTLAGIPEPDALREIERGFSAVDSTAYGEDSKGGGPRTTWFRFPGFADTEAALTWLDDRRLTVFGTDFWAADWVSMSPEAELDLVMRHLHEKGRGIVLFHDTRGQTAKMMPAFLRRLKDEGYRIVHLVPGPASETKTRPAPEGWKSETKEIVARVMPRLLRLPPYSADENGAAAR